MITLFNYLSLTISNTKKFLNFHIQFYYNNRPEAVPKIAKPTRESRLAVIG